MNSIREINDPLDPLLKSLVKEVEDKIAVRGPRYHMPPGSIDPREGHFGCMPIPTPPLKPEIPKHLFEGPKYDGKECAVCKRHFKASSEYLSCKLCKDLVCRRKGSCKHLHSALHRVAFNKAKKERRPPMADLPIGLALKHVREHRRLSQSDLARRMECEQSFVNRIERGNGYPQLGTLINFSIALRIDVWRIVRHACKLQREMERNGTA